MFSQIKTVLLVFLLLLCCFTTVGAQTDTPTPGGPTNTFTPTPSPTPVRTMAWFTVPVTVVTPCPSNFFSHTSYPECLSATSFVVETVYNGRAFIVVKDTAAKIHSISVTADVIYVTPDPRYVASVMQAIAAQKRLNQAKAMGESTVRQANATIR